MLNPVWDLEWLAEHDKENSQTWKELLAQEAQEFGGVEAVKYMSQEVVHAFDLLEQNPADQAEIDPQGRIVQEWMRFKQKLRGPPPEFRKGVNPHIDIKMMKEWEGPLDIVPMSVLQDTLKQEEVERTWTLSRHGLPEKPLPPMKDSLMKFSIRHKPQPPKPQKKTTIIVDVSKPRDDAKSVAVWDHDGLLRPATTQERYTVKRMVNPEPKRIRRTRGRQLAKAFRKRWESKPPEKPEFDF